MAYSLNGTTQYLSKAVAAVTAAPLSIACWFQVTSASATGGYTLVSITDTATDTSYFRLDVSEGSAGRLEAETRNGASTVQSTLAIGSFAANTWYHACGVFASSTSRTVYANGTAGASNTTSSVPAGLDTTAIGNLKRLTVTTQLLSGLIAEVGIWSAALDQQEITALAAGVSPLLVRPTSLVGYAPLFGQYSPEIDLFSPTGYTLTAAPTAAAHCRIVK